MSKTIELSQSDMKKLGVQADMKFIVNDYISVGNQDTVECGSTFAEATYAGFSVYDDQTISFRYSVQYRDAAGDDDLGIISWDYYVQSMSKANDKYSISYDSTDTNLPDEIAELFWNDESFDTLESVVSESNIEIYIEF